MTDDALTLLPSDLPEVEPRAALPRGFRAGAATAGVKVSGRPDLSVVLVEGGAGSVAATFTPNGFASAPVLLGRRSLADDTPTGAGRYGRVAALLSVSGCANAATGDPGMADQARLAEVVAGAIGATPQRVLAVATGMIGPRYPMGLLETAIPTLVADGLRDDPDVLADIAEALRTTDSRPKWATVCLELPGADGSMRPVTVSGVAKGVGMIHPRMATMLAYVLTDADVTPADLSVLLRPIVARTWDQLTVDGDTSTSDTVYLVASGASGAERVVPGAAGWDAFAAAVESVCRSLARQQAADGEGATSLLTCQVSGARDDADARAAARAVVASSLVKAAIHGRDPNWGRIADALGNAQLADTEVLEAAGLSPEAAARRGGSRLDLDPDRIRITIAGVPVFAGTPLPFDAGAASRAMDAEEILVRVDLGVGSGTGEAFGCDLTEAYVRENSEYST
ncbi:MAG: bifunctional ornithine acetyltransferase/N-acetylglutamate synthase [Chloroflexi bacterium]|nr:bifunctional ornithine acetyltransferase/N-acetylglutamate synthase [Chloroflexota bacterium]